MIHFACVQSPIHLYYLYIYVRDVPNRVHEQAPLWRIDAWMGVWLATAQSGLHPTELTFRPDHRLLANLQEPCWKEDVYTQTAENGNSHRRERGSLQTGEWSVRSEQGEGVTLSCRQEETREREGQIAGQRKLGFITPSMSVEQMVEMSFWFVGGRYEKKKNGWADPALALKAFRRSGVITLLILNLDARWNRVYNSSSGWFTPEKSPGIHWIVG